MDIVVYIVLGIFAVLVVRFGFGLTEDKVRARLREDRIDPIRVNVLWWKGTRYQQYIEFEGETTGGRRISGHAIRSGGTIEMYYPVDFDRLEHLRERLQGEIEVAPAEELDLESRIRFETNQRLERIQGSRETFMANDLNHDGTVDADEWDLVRARVEAEVRSEFTDVSAASVVDEVAKVQEVEEQVLASPAPEPDGHW